jgi:hypothetical protein
MNGECIISFLGLVLQVAGWSSFALSRCCANARWIAWSRHLLLGSLSGLGVVTLIAAFFRISCVLSTGFTLFLWLLLILGQIEHSLRVDPYSKMYHEDAA